MRSPGVILVAVAMTVVMLARSAIPVAHACTCEMIDGEAAVNSADLVFVGRFVSRKLSGPVVADGDAYRQLGPATTTFAVEKYLNGLGPPTIEVSDHLCDAVGSPGRPVSYLIFGRLGDGQIESSFCFGSEEVFAPGMIEAYEAITGPGRAPEVNASVDLRENDPPAAPIVAAGVAIPVLFLFRRGVRVAAAQAGLKARSYDR